MVIANVEMAAAWDGAEGRALGRPRRPLRGHRRWLLAGAVGCGSHRP